MEYIEEKEEMDIDLLDLIKYLLRRSGVIIVIAILSALAVYFYVNLYCKPVYRSETTIYVVNTSDDSPSLNYSDLQASSQLVSDYISMFSVKNVYEQVIEDCNLDTTYEKFKGKVKITSKSGTRLIVIAVENNEPEMAKMIADRVRERGAEVISRIFEAEKGQTAHVKVVDEADVPEEPIGPRKVRAAAIGAVVGGLLVMVIYCFVYVLDDKIKNTDDIEKRLGLSTLAVIPVNSKVSRKAKRKKHKKDLSMIKVKTRRNNK